MPCCEGFRSQWYCACYWLCEGRGIYSVRGSDSVVANIGDLVTIPAKAGTDEYRKVNGADSPTRLTGNTFECLAICEDVGSLDIAVDRDPSSYGSPTLPIVPSPTLVDGVSPLSGVGSFESSRPSLPSIAEFSDLSPNCETFKYIKRVDELDFLSLPLSKKKLKKLKKQNHAAKSANASSDARVVGGFFVWFSCARGVGL